ncbi:Rieske 2Fe-2S domain-containing protein [Pseudoxanthomonas winnipegensis]|uniref:Rieske 2Fe-2S domain-containing protein n=1 Tax=Pseudoxanthomonas winnipegensis TaxID=2480810 RepID=UPI003F87DC8F
MSAIASAHPANPYSALPPGSTFTEHDWRLLARQWHPVANSGDVTGAPLQAVLLDEALVVYRVHGEVVVARDVCPHRGVPLSMGTNDGEGVVCPYHGLRFGAGGRCNRIPSSPGQAIPAKLHLATYPTVERYGLVWVCLAPDADNPAPLPVMPHWDQAGFQQINCPPFDINGFAGRQVEGFLDVAHFAWIHTGTFADPANQLVPDYVPVETPTGFTVDYVSNVSNYGVGFHHLAPPDYPWLRHFEVHLPFCASLTIHFPGDERLVIFNCASPVSARRTRLFVPIARNFNLDQPVEEVHAFNLRVFEEDRAMVELQKPERLPLDMTLEAHIPADRSSIAYRRGLKKMGFGEFFLA